jgi:hypothetical protein
MDRGAAGGPGRRFRECRLYRQLPAQVYDIVRQVVIDATFHNRARERKPGIAKISDFMPDTDLTAHLHLHVMVIGCVLQSACARA